MPSSSVPNEEQVFILGPSIARFIPQKDEQILGPKNVINPILDPKPPPVQLPLIYCNICGVSWLVGQKGRETAADHPSHHTLDHIYSGTARSVVAYIDGACPANGPGALQASIGVYFGPGSRKNISRLIDTARPTNQLAEITAAVEAMRVVRFVVVAERRVLVRDALIGSYMDAVRNTLRLRLVLATDSSYLVNCMCDFMPEWTLDETKRIYYNRKGDVIQNSEGFRRLDEEIQLLSAVGVQVMWHHIPRSFNREADALANAALRK